VISSPDDNQTLGGQLKNLKEQLFIDRPHELELFQRALQGEPRTWHILNIYGPGGIGKSTLLDGYRRLSEQRHTPYLYFDASDFAVHPERFVQRCATLLQLDEFTLAATLEEITRLTESGMVVIAIDTYEEAGELNRWLRENFFAHLPKRCLIVIAGRYPLIELWKNHSAWLRLIESAPLANFTHEQSANYLRNSGITEAALIEEAWRNTGGYPLALSLSVMVAERDGPEAMREFANNPDIITALSERWLREINDPKLRTLIEAATINRFFNQEILGAIAGEVVTDQEFRQLINSSLIRRRTHGWSITNMARLALANELNHRAPERYNMLRFRALHTLAQLAINPRSSLNRNIALQEFFYLLGDSLIRAAHYNDEINPRPELHIESAAAHDIPALEKYMEEWRRERGVLANTEVELFDRSSSRTIAQQIASEPREPEFIHIRELVEKFPGSIRVLEDNSNTLHGLTIVLPINAETLEYLQQQPVMGSYFQGLNATEREEYSTPPQQTHNWFVRLIDTRNPSDNSARALLLRDLTAMLLRPARFITSTPLELYQALLAGFGFQKLETPAHYDFGRDRPAPYFMLDLRGENLARHLHAMIKLHMGDAAQLPFESLLAAMHGKEARQQLLKQLSHREQEVALLASEGLPNGVIAAQLDVSEITVKKHMGNIFAKLGVRNRSELIKKFLT
jgi:DNA-binding CsgD family transcriptional regulator